MNYLVLDVATCPIDGAAEFLEEPVAPANYKNPEKIAEYIAEKKAEQVAKLALDPDLGRIAAVGLWPSGEAPSVVRCEDEHRERQALGHVAKFLDTRTSKFCTLVGYNALRFDWPFLVRRARYLGVDLRINTDRFKSTHQDLAELLTHRGTLPMRSLGFYVRRLGWMDLQKPLNGAEEAMAPSRGQWDALEASVLHDVMATQRLAAWLGVWPNDYEQAVGL